MLEFIKDRLKSKIKGWKNNFLSMARKEMMFKSVLSAIPSYALSCFQFSDSLIKEITTISSNFCWGMIKIKGKCILKNGRPFVQQTLKGGIDFRELQSFYQALWANLAWRILTQEDSLLFRILKNKYFQHTSFLKSSCSSTSSWIWKSISWGRDLLQKGIRWMVGCGK